MDRRSAVRIIVTGGVAVGAGSFLLGNTRKTERGAPFALLRSAQPVEEDPRDFTLRSDTVLVLLDVSVKDREGRFVPGLTQKNFSVLEDDRPQRITVFDAQDRPVDLGILVDQSRSMTPKQQEVLFAAQTLIQDSNPRDEVFIIHFNDRVRLGLPPGIPFSSDRSQLREALRRGVPAGRTALNDALTIGLDHLDLGQRDKKAVVLLSDGGDNASRHTRREALERAERGSATIYAVGLSDPENPDLDSVFLRRLANRSGGEAYFPQQAEDLSRVCKTIAREIRTRYTLGYVPPGGNSGIRTIQVRTNTPGQRLKVRTRNRYRYESLEKKK